MKIKIKDRHIRFNFWVPTSFIFSDSIVRIFLWVNEKKTGKYDETITFGIKDDEKMNINIDSNDMRYILKQLREMKKNFPGVPLVEVNDTSGKYVKIDL